MAKNNAPNEPVAYTDPEVMEMIADPENNLWTRDKIQGLYEDAAEYMSKEARDKSQVGRIYKSLFQN